MKQRGKIFLSLILVLLFIARFSPNSGIYQPQTYIYRSEIFTASDGSHYYIEVEVEQIEWERNNPYTITQRFFIDSNNYNNVQLTLSIFDQNQNAVYSNATIDPPVSGYPPLITNVTGSGGYYQADFVITPDLSYPDTLIVKANANFGGPSRDGSHNGPIALMSILIRQQDRTIYDEFLYHSQSELIAVYDYDWTGYALTSEDSNFGKLEIYGTPPGYAHIQGWESDRVTEIQAGFKQGEWDGNFYGINVGMGLYWDQSNLVFPQIVAINTTYSIITMDWVINGVQGGSTAQEELPYLTSQWIYMKINVTESVNEINQDPQIRIGMYYNFDRYGSWFNLKTLVYDEPFVSIYKYQPSMFMIGNGWHKGGNLEFNNAAGTGRAYSYVEYFKVSYNTSRSTTEYVTLTDTLTSTVTSNYTTTQTNNYTTTEVNNFTSTEVNNFPSTVTQPITEVSQTTMYNTNTITETAISYVTSAITHSITSPTTLTEINTTTKVESVFDVPGFQLWNVIVLLPIWFKRRSGGRE